MISNLGVALLKGVLIFDMRLCERFMRSCEYFPSFPWFWRVDVAETDGRFSRTVQLVATAIFSAISFFSESFKIWIQTNSWMLLVSLFGSLGFLFATYWKRKSYPTNLLFLSGFTLLEAYTVAVATSFYDSRIVLEAVVITGGLFVGLTLFACQTKYDFSSWYSYLYGALWLLIIFGFVAAFFPTNSAVELVYSGIAALLFSAYIVSRFLYQSIRGDYEKQKLIFFYNSSSIHS
jgi:FtsH-binding integral membrane protein